MKQYLEQLGHHVTMVDPSDSPWFNYSTSDIVIFEGVSKYYFIALAVNRTIRKSLKVIFTHGSFYEHFHSSELENEGYAPPRRIWRLIKRVSVITWLKVFMDTFDFVFVLSKTEKQEVMREFGIVNATVEVLDNFEHEFIAAPSRLGQIPIEGFSPYVCAISRVDYRKNFLAVLKAINGTGVHFVLAGMDHGALRELNEFAISHSMTNFHYLGQISEEAKFWIIANSIATILPSFFEGVPFLAYESLQMNKPVIITKNSYIESLPGIVKCSPEPNSIREAILSITNHFPSPSSHKIRSGEDVANDFLSLVGYNKDN